ncbi:hypothetical protein ACHHYP_00009 [Achlya hypogyna]|uniref:Secreted protein n=1 Tax=Achlya hypogyna TaxID=1202772 RepID=A0A0A7CLM4_ACHHY|nr:secreted protein [Achlya hypogyna]OQR95916.1 hypothetical protein ACHHYP_00009 [Achlya hypogyna]
MKSIAVLAAVAIGSVSAADCTILNFLGLSGVATDPNGVFATCSKDINEPVSKMMDPNWIPSSYEMVNAFAASNNCKAFYKTVADFMVTISPPCTLHQAGVTQNTDVAGKIPFDTSIATWRNYYKPTTAPPTTVKPTTVAPTTVAPTTVKPTTAVPTTKPNC